MALYVGNVVAVPTGYGYAVVLIGPEHHRGKVFGALWRHPMMSPQNQRVNLAEYANRRIEFEVLYDTLLDEQAQQHSGWGIVHITPPPWWISAAIHRFAPEVHLHPDDPYRPASVPWFLARVHMRYHRTNRIIGVPLPAPDKQILDKGKVDRISLLQQQFNEQFSGVGREPTNFFLQIPNDGEQEFITRQGYLASAVCYVHFRRAPAAWEYDIQYWFFYPYNGNITNYIPGHKLEHEGDWEHVTVRVTENLSQVAKVFFATHKAESKWLTTGFGYNAAGHPVVYSAKHSHATYPTAGRHDRQFPLPEDVTALGGPVWETWRSWTQTGEVDAPYFGQEWITYTGRWGELGLQPDLLVTSGPYGPAFQPWWEDDDEMIA